MYVRGAGFFSRHDNIYAYVPNLIGYFRIVSAIYSFAISMHHPLRCVIFYFIGFVCDELDGRFARLFQQTSQFGVVLDMVTDRLSTAGLLVLLCMLYQECFVIFLGLLMLDIFSHWSQMYYTLTTGNITHKDVQSKSWLVRTYYRNRLFMGFCCVSCEVLYLALYLLCWKPPNYLLVKRDIFRKIQDFAQEYVPRKYILPGEVESGAVSLVWTPLVVAVPGFIAKQIINVFQLRNALSGLVNHELTERRNHQD